MATFLASFLLFSSGIVWRWGRRAPSDVYCTCRGDQPHLSRCMYLQRVGEPCRPMYLVFFFLVCFWRRSSAALSEFSTSHVPRGLVACHRSFVDEAFVAKIVAFKMFWLFLRANGKLSLPLGCRFAALVFFCLFCVLEVDRNRTLYNN